MDIDADIRIRMALPKSQVVAHYTHYQRFLKQLILLACDEEVAQLGSNHHLLLVKI